MSGIKFSNSLVKFNLLELIILIWKTSNIEKLEKIIFNLYKVYHEKGY
jgi:hypothetical protein